MRNFTLKLWAAGSLLLALLLGTQTVAAAEFPAIEELYGRYRFSGELTAEFMNGMTGEPVDVVLPGTTDYDMVVLPGSGENEVQVLGFFGYGGGVTLSYDAQTGTLSGGFQEVLFCQGSGSLIVTVTAPYDPSAGGYVGTVDFKFKVGMVDGTIVLTSENALSDAQYIDYTTYDMGSMTYASGYTLTKEDVTADLSGLAGTYEFTSQVLDMNTLPDGSDLFDLEVSVSGGKVCLDNWFGVSGTAVEATYYEDGGILVLPHDAALSNGMYFGQEPEGMPNGNAAPYLLVNGDKLVLPGYVSLNNGSEDMGEMLMPIQYAIIGGEAVKKADGDGIASYHNTADGICVSDGVIYVTNAEEAPVVVYDLAGVKVAEANGASVAISGLQSGIYVVKAGNRTAKVALK